MSTHEVPVPHLNMCADYTEMHTYLLPLNSKRLMTNSLKHIAQALELPTTSSSDEIRTLVNGRLTELGREPRNTQVQVHRSGVIELTDPEGMFLKIDEELPLFLLTSKEYKSDLLDDGSNLQMLKKVCVMLNIFRMPEATQLNAKIESLSRHCKEPWNLNGSQLAEFNEILLGKDK